MLLSLFNMYRVTVLVTDLSRPEKGLDIVWLEGQDVLAGAQRLVELLQFELSSGQVVKTLHPIFPHLFLLCSPADVAAI